MCLQTGETYESRKIPGFLHQEGINKELSFLMNGQIVQSCLLAGEAEEGMKTPGILDQEESNNYLT